jgi:N-acetylneuraminate lyase
MRLLILSVVIALSAAVPIPEEILLASPYSPYLNDELRTINPSVIQKYAEHAKKFGVNTIWTVGGMGQFSYLTIAERKTLFAEWVKTGHQQGIFMIAHIGASSQGDAIELTKHALAVGADALAAVPPYYASPNNWEDMIDWFKPVLAHAPNLPFYYYHIPGSTHVNLRIIDFLKASQGGRFPQLRGVKFVSDDWDDWTQCVRQFNKTYHLLWANEPKIRSFPIGGLKGAIIAETFYTPSYMRMKRLYDRGDLTGAQAEQDWKSRMESVMNRFPDAKRALMKALAGIEMGPPRIPDKPINQQQYNQLITDLTAAGFFNQTLPPF